jgi:hypothetical protein
MGRTENVRVAWLIALQSILIPQFVPLLKKRGSIYQTDYHENG